ncbi:MAG: hypothetical protein ACRDNM_07190 [Gaiellaceae bacterium]
MAADVTGTELVTSTPAPTPPTPDRAALYPHRPRFLFVYGLLGGVLAVALALVVIYAGRAITPGPKWSAWHPSGGGLGAAKQIADQVGKTYRLPNGDQLVDVLAKTPSVSPASSTPIPLHYVAFQGKGAPDPVAISSSNSVSYELCGLGAACSIATGKASVARGTLVRREILELALYTFKYVGGMKSIIAFMPPPAGTQAEYVIYLQKSDLTAELKQPLSKTLGAKVPLPAAIPAREVHAIDSVTKSRVYKFGLAQAPTGDAILVLTPLPA